MKVPGLTEDEQISPEAAAVLGLSTNDIRSVNQLYLQAKLRLEQLERGNFVRPNPKKTSYILRAFPEEASALRRGWLTSLTELIGADRAGLLDQFIRIPLPLTDVRTREDIERHIRRTQAGPRWFDRGLFEMRIDVQRVVGASGREGLTIRYQSDRPEGGEVGGSLSDLPERFRHLLTSDMLDELGPL
jgi:hypothetical protein